MKMKDEPESEPIRTISINKEDSEKPTVFTPEMDQKVETENTKRIEKLDTSMPLEKAVKEATIVKKEPSEWEKEQLKREIERQIAMKEMHKTAWDTY